MGPSSPALLVVLAAACCVLLGGPPEALAAAAAAAAAAEGIAGTRWQANPAVVRPLHQRPLPPPPPLTRDALRAAAAAATTARHPAEPAARRARAARRALAELEAGGESSSSSGRGRSSSSRGRGALALAPAPAAATARRQNATLEMFGSVVDGYFYTTVLLGTPPRPYDVIVDTGSTMTYVPCEGCALSGACGLHVHGEAGSAFDPGASSTARRVACGDEDCRCGSPPCSCRPAPRGEAAAADAKEEAGAAAAPDPTPPNGACSYSRVYAERSSSSGDVVSDVLHLDVRGNSSSSGSSGSSSSSAAARPRITFGCATRETGEIHRQQADGLLGMGASDDALHAQLARAGVTDAAFGLCLGFPSGGALVLGSAVPTTAAPAAAGAAAAGAAPRMQYTPLLGGRPANPSSSRGAHYFAVAAEGLAYAGDELRFSSGAAAEGGGAAAAAAAAGAPAAAASSSLNVGYGTVFDSGTTFLYLPTPAFEAFKAAALKAAEAAGLEPRPGPDPEFADVCWSLRAGGALGGGGGGPAAATERLMRALESGPSRLPHAELRFAGGARLDLGPRRYLWRDDAGDGGGGGGGDGGGGEGRVCLGVFENGREGTLVGAVATRGAFLQYDVARRRLGFADADCGALGAAAAAAAGGAGGEAAAAPSAEGPPAAAAAAAAAAVLAPPSPSPSPSTLSEGSAGARGGGLVAGAVLGAAVAGAAAAGAVALLRWWRAKGPVDAQRQQPQQQLWRPVSGADDDDDDDDGTQLAARPWASASASGAAAKAAAGDGGGNGGGGPAAAAAVAARGDEERALMQAALATTATRSGPL
jgi:hypothetical protein